MPNTVLHSEERGSRADKMLLPQAHQGGMWQSAPRHTVNRKEAMEAKAETPHQMTLGLQESHSQRAQEQQDVAAGTWAQLIHPAAEHV